MAALSTTKLLNPGRTRVLSVLHFFYKNNFVRTRGSFSENLRTIPASAEEQSHKFSIKVVNKTAASAT